jgi:hypothetical protein
VCRNCCLNSFRRIEIWRRLSFVGSYQGFEGLYRYHLRSLRESYGLHFQSRRKPWRGRQNASPKRW